MKKIIPLIIIFNTCVVFGQQVVEIRKVEPSQQFKETFEDLKLYSDSGLAIKIGILEKSLSATKHEYEKYRIIIKLGNYYTASEQYDKATDMWIAANKAGIIFPFDLKKKGNYRYIQKYADNKRFLYFMALNDSLKQKANATSKAEYFVKVPENYDPSDKYPLIIILHGGWGNSYSVFNDWNAEMITNSFIAVYPQGRQIIGSYTRKYGPTGLKDITEIYNQVINKYAVDTSKIVLAGQSLGGELSLRLSHNNIPVQGLLLAFPVKPKDFNYRKAIELKIKDVRIVMICGQQDKRFFSGQQEMESILETADVDYKFITYPDLGHWFPKDFSEQLDNGLHYILNYENYEY